MRCARSLLAAIIFGSLVGCSSTNHQPQTYQTETNLVTEKESKEEPLYGYPEEEPSDTDILILQLDVDLQKSLLKLGAEKELELASVVRNSPLNSSSTDKLINEYTKEMENLSKLKGHYIKFKIPKDDENLRDGVNLMLKKLDAEIRLYTKRIEERTVEVEMQQSIDLKVQQQEVERKFAVEKSRLIAKHDYEVKVVLINETIETNPISSTLRQEIESLESEVASLTHQAIEMGVDNL
ncbi:hypothetical protein [Vibrio sp. D431a]|uniref:hypothetical protein n=1 Tax=Vibrio sp. D431a TaxID=2837388 RepID=UPI002555F37B|nr:hypothetical protein [Vibrio sp. D431a]MDK9793897.1 hypothetical protein [Vibrio sp. D431a]